MKLRSSKSAVVALCALAIPAATAGAASAASTTVTPAGDYAQSALASGSNATFTIAGFMTVTCNQSTTSPTTPLGTNTNNQVPLAPANHNNNGPVSTNINPPTFKNNGGACPTNLFGTTASTTTNSTNGAWKLSGQNGTTITGSMTIPRAGAVTTTSNGCTITIAPSSAATVSGTWTNGSGGSASRIAISGASVPVSVSGGFGCPSASTASFSANYDVTDVSNSSASIVVGP
ncbi:MAG TPA: hypothetical protein VF520_12080 [Thermoleophilaceae bacterium]|jgi:hypothetical protein